MEELNNLLRQTIATTTADEVCFIYVPKERIDQTIFAARFGDAQVQSDGVTYSFDKPKLELCFKATPQTAPLATHTWTLSVTPFADREITSVAVPAQNASRGQDHIIATYLPGHAAATAGMTMVHFFQKDEADAFRRAIECRAA